jgi:hypothetical protein
MRPSPALLHRLPDVPGQSPISDVDLVWGERISRGSLRQLQIAVLDALGLKIALVWPYDHDSVSVFALSADAARGIHLDLVHDDAGRGRLGIRYPAMLNRARAKDGTVGMVDDIDRLIYLARKRQWKRQSGEYRQLQGELLGRKDEAMTRISEILIRSAARDLRRSLQGSHVVGFKRSAGNMVVSAIRFIRRFARPIGFWAHLPDDDGRVADALEARFSLILIRTRAVRFNGTVAAAIPDWVRAVAPIRWRAGVVVSFGTVPPWMHPDAVISVRAKSVGDVAAEIVGSMHTRALF